LFRTGSAGVFFVQVERSGAIRRENDPRPIRRPNRRRVNSGVERKSRRAAADEIEQPDVAPPALLPEYGQTPSIWESAGLT
jgi:hypothetical protein